MAEVMYIDPILRKYVDLILSKTNIFKRIYYGDPVRIGVSELPALIIEKTGTKVSNFSNVGDEHEFGIVFTVVTDVRDTISDDKDMVRGINSLYNIMEGRDDTTLLLKPECLTYILRHYVELDPNHDLRTDLATMTDIKYGMALGKRKDGAWSSEATITITASTFQNR